MSWWDFLSDVADAGTGIAKGLDAGMKPLATWEGIRTSDLKNDASEIGNRNLEYEQQAREGADVPAWYGDWRDAGQSTFRGTTAKNELGTYGNQQLLAMQQYLADPEQGFQRGVREAGWEPGSPEYREWLAEAMGMFDPSGAVAARDKMNIPGLRQDNLDQQATTDYLQNWVRQNGPDPNAEVVRLGDGTIAVRDSETGDLHPIEIPGGGNALVRAAAMMDAKTPYAAISGALADEGKIQTINTAAYKAMQDGKITPAAAFKYYQDERIAADKVVQSTLSELNALRKVDVNMMEPEAKAAHVAQVEQKTRDLAAARQRAAQHAQLAQQVLSSPQMQNAIPGNNRGQASVTAPRFNAGGTDPNAPAARRQPTDGAPVARTTVPIEQTLQAAAGAQKRPPYVDRRNQARVVRGQIQQQPDMFGAPQQQQPGGVGAPAQKAQQLISTLQSMGLPPQVITRMLQAMAGG